MWTANGPLQEQNQQDKGVGPGTVYTRGKASDHMAQKVTVLLYLVEKGKAGNRAIINYNNREGCTLYMIMSNKYAPKSWKQSDYMSTKMKGNTPSNKSSTS